MMRIVDTDKFFGSDSFDDFVVEFQVSRDQKVRFTFDNENDMKDFYLSVCRKVNDISVHY
jgi:hypothetical protein